MGTEWTKLASIRVVIDGPRLKTDPIGPRSADGILEGYRAVYIGADRSVVDVYAVLFNDAELTGRALMSRLGAPRRVIVHGPIAIVLLQSASGDCFKAVTEHLDSIR